MEGHPPSSTQRSYIVGLEAPRVLAAAVSRRQNKPQAVPAHPCPLPPMLPILQTFRRPPPPVPGLLPPADTPVAVARECITCEDWLIHPVNMGRWPLRLAQTLRETWNSSRKNTAASSETPRILPLNLAGRRRPAAFQGSETPRILPLNLGIPVLKLAHAPVTEPVDVPETASVTQPVQTLPLPIGWRRMNLICLELEYFSENTWPEAVIWRSIWVRRLARAPAPR